MHATFLDKIAHWMSKGVANEKIAPPYTKNKTFSPKVAWDNSKIKLKFNGSCLKQHKAMN